MGEIMNVPMCAYYNFGFDKYSNYFNSVTENDCCVALQYP